jgi:flagellar basal body rod protein FlgC
MVDSVAANDYASSAIAAADVQIAAVTDSIATQIDTAQPTAPFGSSAVAAPPVTGTQPSNAASQVFQALQSPASTSTGSGATGVAPSVSRSDNYDISYQPDSPSADAQGLVAQPNVNPGLQTAQLVASANSFSTTAQFLQTGAQLSHRILDLTTSCTDSNRRYNR